MVNNSLVISLVESYNITLEGQGLNDDIDETIRNIQNNILNEVHGILNADKTYKFIGKLSTDSQGQIRNLILTNFPNPPPLERVTFQRKAIGLTHFHQDGFQLEGEPDDKNTPYLQPGQIINPGQPEEFIFIRPKRFGVEPGYEKVFLRDILPGGAIYETCLGCYNHLLDGGANPLGYQDWVAQQANRQRLVAELAKNPKILNTVLYFDKLDYRKLPHSNTVKVPTHRAKNIIHRQNTADTIENKNCGAIMEVLANDIYRALGMPSQQAYLIRSAYPTGEDKFLISSKCVTGMRGELFNTFDGNIHFGQLIGNRLISTDENRKHRIYRLDQQQLSLAKNSQRLLADRDGIGLTGSNIGYYVDAETNEVQIVNIDPGKSLEAAPKFSFQNIDAFVQSRHFFIRFFQRLFFNLTTILIGQTDQMRVKDFNSDCTFSKVNQTIRDFFQKSYANFSAFDDIPLSENMKCMRKLIRNRAKVDGVFDEYAEKFRLNPAYLESINHGRARFNERLDYFSRVLASRINLSGDQLTILENLEKLTSKTTNFAGNNKSWSALQHLKVLSGHRKEWNMNVDADGNCEVWFEAKNKSEKNTVIKRLRDFDANLEPGVNGFRLSIRVLSNRIPAFLELISEAAIATHKNQFLFPESGAIRVLGVDYNLYSFNQIQNLCVVLNNNALSEDEKIKIRVFLKSAIKLKKLKIRSVIKQLNKGIKKLKKLNRNQVDPNRTRKISLKSESIRGKDAKLKTLKNLLK